MHAIKVSNFKKRKNSLNKNAIGSWSNRICRHESLRAKKVDEDFFPRLLLINDFIEISCSSQIDRLVVSNQLKSYVVHQHVQ